jgi:hypothetical protein
MRDEVLAVDIREAARRLSLSPRTVAVLVTREIDADNEACLRAVRGYTIKLIQTPGRRLLKSHIAEFHVLLIPVSLRASRPFRASLE